MRGIPKGKIIGKLMLLIVFTYTHTGFAESLCKDFLKELGHKPAYVKYKSCKKESPNYQLHYTATYTLESKYAKQAEDFLVKNFKMARLKFRCCGWEAHPWGGARKKVGNLDYDYIIEMHSLETTEKNWNRIPRFYITVKLYPGTI